MRAHARAARVHDPHAALPSAPQSHAVIDTRAGKVRTTWAAKDFKMHDVMAKIPMTAAIWFPHDYSDFADLGECHNIHSEAACMQR